MFIERTDAKAEAPILWSPDEELTHWKDLDAGKDWGQEGKGTTEHEIVSGYHWLNGHEFEQTSEDSEGQRSLEWCSSWGHRKLDMT